MIHSSSCHGACLSAAAYSPEGPEKAEASSDYDSADNPGSWSSRKPQAGKLNPARISDRQQRLRTCLRTCIKTLWIEGYGIHPVH